MKSKNTKNTGNLASIILLGGNAAKFLSDQIGNIDGVSLIMRA